LTPWPGPSRRQPPETTSASRRRHASTWPAGCATWAMRPRRGPCSRRTTGGTGRPEGAMAPCSPAASWPPCRSSVTPRRRSGTSAPCSTRHARTRTSRPKPSHWTGWAGPRPSRATCRGRRGASRRRTASTPRSGTPSTTPTVSTPGPPARPWMPSPQPCRPALIHRPADRPRPRWPRRCARSGAWRPLLSSRRRPSSRPRRSRRPRWHLRRRGVRAVHASSCVLIGPGRRRTDRAGL
jgi:hypothetical protein